MGESDDIQAAAESAPRYIRSWVLIFVVIIATGIAVWLVPEPETPVPETSPQESAIAPGLQTAPKPEPETATESETEPAPEVESAPEAEPAPEVEIEPASESQARPGDRAREIITRLGEGAGSGEEALVEAQRQLEAGHPEDAYLLYFFAAKQGHAEAALVLGKQADPAHFDPAGGVFQQADPQQAYKWYRMAADNGSVEAERSLETLFEGVEKSAAAGDDRARRLLLQWR